MNARVKNQLILSFELTWTKRLSSFTEVRARKWVVFSQYRDLECVEVYSRASYVSYDMVL